MSQGFSGDNNREGVNVGSDATSQASDLLRTVLESTLSSSNKSLNDEELRALAQLAKSSASDLPLSQVTLQLVSHLLKLRFGNAASVNASNAADTKSPTPFDNMSKSIAETLCNDPTSARRLAQFWQLLRESSL